MADQLQLYNEALTHCKETKLATLAENRASRRALDLHYAETMKYMLEQGYWHFAMRSVSITADTSVAPAFGPRQAFNTPDDWVKTYQLSTSDTFDPPLEDWIKESNLFWADQDLIYLRYVSNSALGYGGDLTMWTSRFQLAFTLELACRTLPVLSGSDVKLEKLEERAHRAASDALSFEAMTEPPRRPPMGNWNRARFFGRGGRNENRA